MGEFERLDSYDELRALAERELTGPLAGGYKKVLRAAVAAGVAVERPDWLWRRWLPRGALGLLIGRQGDGKTTWATHVVACLSTGKPLPDGSLTGPLRVGVMSGEESPGRLRARLEAAGADLHRVFILTEVTDGGVERQWRFPDDLDALEERIKADGLDVVVIDGVGYMLEGKGGEAGYGVAGAALSALAKVAERTRCAVLGVTHPPKGASDPVTAAIGSTAWTAIPRVTWVLGRHPENDTVRVVRVAKTSYGEPPTGYEFAIRGVDDLDAGYVVDVHPSEVTAVAITAAPGPVERRMVDEAADWLRDVLAAGPVEVAELKRLARDTEWSWRTVQRARERAGVEVNREGSGRDGSLRSVWLLVPRPLARVDDGDVGTSNETPSDLGVSPSDGGDDGYSCQAAESGTSNGKAPSGGVDGRRCDRCGRLLLVWPDGRRECLTCEGGDHD